MWRLLNEQEAFIFDSDGSGIEQGYYIETESLPKNDKQCATLVRSWYIAHADVIGFQSGVSDFPCHCTYYTALEKLLSDHLNETEPSDDHVLRNISYGLVQVNVEEA